MTVRVTLVACAVAGCSGSSARVHLVPIDLGACGRPAVGDVVTVRVTAYGARGEKPDGVLAASGQVWLRDFPSDTQQIGVELVGASGTIAAGKTAPLQFDSLRDGADVPIAVVPLGGFCAVGPMTAPRAQPLVAPAGDGALVVGGAVDGNGMPIGDAEYYDRATASFTPVALPSGIVDATAGVGMAGGVLTPLPDGRVALSGTSAHTIVIFDPKTLTFGTPTLFGRVYHAALATAPDRVFVIGGCADVASGGGCSGPSLRSSFAYHVDDLTMRDPGPVLPLSSQRYGATLLDTGRDGSGVEQYLVAGGFGDAGQADRFALGDAGTTTIGGLAAQIAALDGGAVLSAFARDGDPASGASTQLAPGGASPAPLALAPALAGARLIALEDGSVLAVGGDGFGFVTRYVPTINAWKTDPPLANPAGGAATGPLVAPALARLSDGSVLVIGTASVGSRSATAWIYRPSLVGATSGAVLVRPDGSAPGVLTASDATTAAHAATAFTLTAADATLAARALVGGPRTASGSVDAAVTVRAGGVALIAQQVGPGRALVAELLPGAPARIARHDGAATPVECTGQVVAAFDPSAPVAVGLAVAGKSATLSIAHVPVATCDLSRDPDAADAGAWGIAADGAGAIVDIATITADR